MEALNGLNFHSDWNNLGDVVRRSYGESGFHRMTVRGRNVRKELRLENHIGHRMRYLRFESFESNPSDDQGGPRWN